MKNSNKGAKAPTPKRELMARLKAERNAAGLYRYSYWATVEQKVQIDAAIAKITNNEG